MTSKKQIEANKQNALKGGVKTEAGKTVSRMNATKYGFFSKIITEYDKLEHSDFCKEIYACFKPESEYEKQLVEILLSNFLTYRRICFVEREYIQTKLDPDIDIGIKLTSSLASSILNINSTNFSSSALKITRLDTGSHIIVNATNYNDTEYMWENSEESFLTSEDIGKTIQFRIERNS